ncbi:MAG TPA: tetratricopeptide repeat protein, partial [Rhodothermales bacterium]
QPRMAIEELSRMPVLYSGNPEWEAQAFLVQARAYRRMGQNGEAMQMYQRVIEDYGDTPYARTAATERESL